MSSSRVRPRAMQTGSSRSPRRAATISSPASGSTTTDHVTLLGVRPAPVETRDATSELTRRLISAGDGSCSVSSRTRTQEPRCFVRAMACGCNGGRARAARRTHAVSGEVARARVRARRRRSRAGPRLARERGTRRAVCRRIAPSSWHRRWRALGCRSSRPWRIVSRSRARTSRRYRRGRVAPRCSRSGRRSIDGDSDRPPARRSRLSASWRGAVARAVPSLVGAHRDGDPRELPRCDRARARG